MTPSSGLCARSVGGLQPLALLEPPSAPDGAPVVGVLPALGVRADYYGDLARALAGHGLRVVLADLPGHGDSPARPRRDASWGLRDLVSVHAAAVRRAARERFPLAPFVWLGHSLGGQVALLDAGASAAAAGAGPGPAVAGVALFASGSPYYRAWPGLGPAWVLAATQACAAVATALGTFPGHRLGFAGHEARGLMRDWARVARTGSYRLADLDGEALLAAWRGPTLAVALVGDRFAPRRAFEHLLAKTRSPVTWDPWEGGVDHIRWPRLPGPAARRVAKFVGGLAEEAAART